MRVNLVPHLFPYRYSCNSFANLHWYWFRYVWSRECLLLPHTNFCRENRSITLSLSFPAREELDSSAVVNYHWQSCELRSWYFTLVQKRNRRLCNLKPFMLHYICLRRGYTIMNSFNMKFFSSRKIKEPKSTPKKGVYLKVLQLSPCGFRMQIYIDIDILAKYE